MKKYTPYIFPLIVVVIVFFLVYRWYSVRTDRDPQQADLGEGIQIENLTPEQLQNMSQGSKDLETATMESGMPDAETAGIGTIRYEIVNGKVNFSVLANLPDSATPYTVWVRSKDGSDLTQAFTLEMGKGGFMGTAAVSEERLPLEVIVSQAATKEAVMESVVLKGMIEPEAVKTEGAN